MFFLDTALFFLSTVLTSLLIYYEGPYVLYQQIVSVLLAVSLILMGRFGISKQRKTQPLWVKMIAVLLSSVLIQLLILSSGGFYSPLLILLHIYTIATIFLLNNKAPILFLVFTLGLLIFQISADPNLHKFFEADPWTAVIYGISILIVIPLALYLSHSYFIKDTFTKILKDYIQMEERKEASILKGLSDLVIVTDSTLTIVSVNIAAEKALQLTTEQIVGKPFLDIFILKDQQGNGATPNSLSIDQALADKATRIVEGFNLETKRARPTEVSIQVRPLTDPKGTLTQVVFVLTEGHPHINYRSHPSLLAAFNKRNTLLTQFNSLNSDGKTAEAVLPMMLLTHIEDDILTAQEMEDHQITETITLFDVVALAKTVVDKKAVLAKSLGKNISFTFADEEGAEAALLSLNEQTISTQQNISPSRYSAPIDTFLMGVLIEKCLDLGLFCLYHQPPTSVSIQVYIEVDGTIRIKTSFPLSPLTEPDVVHLLEKEYPQIADKNGLKYASGLEGYILKVIAHQTAIPLSVAINPAKTEIVIELTITKQPKAT